MSVLNRILSVVPGYDCREICTDPRHEKTFGKRYATPGQSHGLHGEEWTYVVSDGEAAVNLTIYTSRFPTSAAAAAKAMASIGDDRFGNMAADLGLHTGYPRYEGHGAMDSCTWLGGRRCYYDGSGLRAKDFWRAHGDGAQADQNEFFWLALEAEFREWTEIAGRERNTQSAPTTEKIK